MPANRPRSRTFIDYRTLLELAAGDGDARLLDTAQLRARYIEIGQLPEPEPCAACGHPATDRVGDVTVHLACADPAPGSAAGNGTSPAPAPATPRPAAGPGEHAPATGHPGRQEAAPRPARPQARRPRAAEGAGDRWRAPAAVLDADGIYLPGGERLRLPQNLGHAGILADFPRRLNLGWGGGKLTPSTGQLWLTAGFCQKIAGLPLPGKDLSSEDRDALLTEAAASPWLAQAIAGGWLVSEASRTRLEHRMRIWRDDNRAGAQIVFIPYISGDVALLDRDPDPAALAERLSQYTRLTGVPYGRSASYSGHDLVMRLDSRRKIVLDGPADPPPVWPSGSGIVSFQRDPSPEEEHLEYVHSYDVTAAWLAAAKRTELGVGAAEHKDRPEFDPKLPGLWRITPPKWDMWQVPDPFKARRPGKDGTIWVYTPLLAMVAGLLDVDIEPAEAWVWPRHTRYLNLWASEMDKARRALEGPPPAWRPDSPDDAAVLAAIKDTYSGAITLFGSPQLAADPERGRPAHRLHRPDWTHMVITTAAARLYRKIFAAAQATGRWPLGIDQYNLLYASASPDPDEACPERLVPIRPGQDKKPIGNGLGQVKCKGSALMKDAGPLLAAGKFHFGEHLTSREGWNPAQGRQQQIAGKEGRRGDG